MAVEELEIVRLKDDFYRDGFYKILTALITILIAVFSLIGISIYLYMAKPLPVTFNTDPEWRILAPVPLNKPYLSIADLSQWISDVLPTAFTYDFVNYTKQLQGVMQYFTPNGWQKFLEIVNNYANYNNVVAKKLFISSTPGAAPFVLNQGLLEDRYGWWVQMALNVNYFTNEKNSVTPLTIKTLIVRVPTLNNIYGVGIENMTVTQTSPPQILSEREEIK